MAGGESLRPAAGLAARSLVDPVPALFLVRGNGILIRIVAVAEIHLRSPQFIYGFDHDI
jgi:hypothetical protein